MFPIHGNITGKITYIEPFPIFTMNQQIPMIVPLVPLGGLLAEGFIVALRIEPSTLAHKIIIANEGSNSRERVKDGGGGSTRWN
jgi:hypothetical protein